MHFSASMRWQTLVVIGLVFVEIFISDKRSKVKFGSSDEGQKVPSDTDREPKGR